MNIKSPAVVHPLANFQALKMKNVSALRSGQSGSSLCKTIHRKVSLLLSHFHSRSGKLGHRHNREKLAIPLSEFLENYPVGEALAADPDPFQDTIAAKLI